MLWSVDVRDWGLEGRDGCILVRVSDSASTLGWRCGLLMPLLSWKVCTLTDQKIGDWKDCTQ